MPPSAFDAEAGDYDAGDRLDVFLAGTADDASRSLLKRLIKDGGVMVNGEVCTRPSRVVHAGDRIHAELPDPPTTALEPEPIPLDIIHEDADVLVINKPAGLVVHPAPGHASGTLVNAVLHHCPELRGASPGEALRPGIVHRLDRDTSGVMVVAKSPKAFDSLSQQARDHAFDRRYLALVRGNPQVDSGRIDAAVGRSLADRTRMAVTGVRGRDAITRFMVLERLVGPAALLALELETGRTHQIRVHLRFIGHPVLGDPVYGVTDFRAWPVPDAAHAALEALVGQALHAEHLGFTHPRTGAPMAFTVPPPADFQLAHHTLRVTAEQ